MDENKTPLDFGLTLTPSAPAAPRVSYLANGARLRDATGAEGGCSRG